MSLLEITLHDRSGKEVARMPTKEDDWDPAVYEDGRTVKRNGKPIHCQGVTHADGDTWVARLWNSGDPIIEGKARLDKRGLVWIEFTCDGFLPAGWDAVGMGRSPGIDDASAKP